MKQQKSFTSSDLNFVFRSKIEPLFFSGASIDSRIVKKGHIFFAIKGKFNDGHKFLNQAEKNGAIVAVVQRKSRSIKIPQIVVHNSHKAMIRFAKHYRSQLKAKFIGITGSVGKTGTKDALNYILSKHKRAYCSRKSYNNKFGVPLEIINMPFESEVGIFELGMNHKNEIKEITRILKPHIAVILNINYVHSENFKSLKDIALAKSEIFTSTDNIETLVLNKEISEFSLLKRLANKSSIKKIVTFSKKEKTTIFLKSQRVIKNQLILKVSLGLKGIISYKIDKTHEFLLSNSLAILACLLSLNFNPNLINRLINYPLSPGRGNILKCLFNNKRIKIIDHTYNASPVSMISTIRSFSELKDKNKIFIIGDMNELGRKSLVFHKKILKLALSQSFDYCVFVGKNFNNLSNLTRKKNVSFVNSVEELIKNIELLLQKNCSIFIKGSNSIRLNKIIEYLV